MSKLSRVFQNLFGLNGATSHFEQFGARKTGSANFTKDPNTLQSLSAFITGGWADAVNPTNNAPFLEDMNGLFYLLFYQLCQIFQDGIPAWDPSTTYFIGSFVRKDGTGELYSSLVDNNVGNALPNQTGNANWTYANPQGVAAGVMADFGGSAAPFSWLLCDGSVYAQAAQPALFAAISTNWNIGGEGAGNFRVPDIRGRTTIGAGTGSGLSPRVLAVLLGEENHILTPAECAQLAHIHDMSHQHDLPVAIQGSQVFFPPNSAFNPGGTSWPYERTRTDLAYWVQGVAGIGAAASISWFKTAPTDTANTGSANYSGSGSNGSPHNNMQPSAVVTKIIKT